MQYKEKNNILCSTCFDLIKILVVQLNKDGKINLVNEEGTRILGYKNKKELIGKGWFDIAIPASHHQEVKNIFKKIIEGKEKIIEHYVNPIKDRENQIKLISWHNKILKDDNGKIIGVISSGEDITEKKIAEEALQESEKKFRNIFENSLDGIIIANVETKKFIEGNRSICKMLGYSFDEIKKLDVSQIHPKKDLKYVLKQFKLQSEGKIRIAENLPCERKDKTIFFADVSASSINIRGEKYIVGLFRDITEKKKTEAALRESEEKYQSIFESANDIILLYNRFGKIIDINKKLTDISGFKVEEITNKNILSLRKIITPKGLVTIASKMKDRLLGKEVGTYEVDLKDKKGRVVTMEINGATLRSKNKITGGLIIMRDVTKRIEIDKMKSEFISVASHQLRTPLSGIKWLLEIMSENTANLTKEQQFNLKEVTKYNEKMITLVNDLLSVSRIEASKIEICPQKVQFIKLAEKSISQLTPIADKKQIKIICHYPKKELPKLFVDPERMQEAFSNILSNAIKYSKENSQIDIFCEQTDHQLTFCIHDQGIGIPLDQQNRIFEKFFRGKNVLETNTEGTGLGLFIAKSIIESSNGEIWFESEEGRGTKFYFSLPTTKNKKNVKFKIK